MATTQPKLASATSFLWSGCGFGGSCFPKDVKAIAAHADKRGVATPLLDSVLEINRTQPQRMVELLRDRIGDPKGRRINVLGIAFKPGTDDVRESPALPIIRYLLDAGVTVRAHDPAAMDAARAALPGVTWCTTPHEAAAGAHVVALITEWNEFRALNLASLATVMAGRTLIDLRNVYEAADLAGSGLDYQSVGRPSLKG